MKKSPLLIALFAFALVGSTVDVLAEGTLDRLKQQGYATVAVANEPPYSDIRADGYVTGAAPEVARAVLKKLGVPELRSQVIMYGAMIPALQARRVDLSTSGLYIKPKRCESIIYSEPDLCGAEAFAVKKGNPLNIMTYEDIGANPDVTMTTCAGCAEEAYALERGVTAGSDQGVYRSTEWHQDASAGSCRRVRIVGARHPGSAEENRRSQSRAGHAGHGRSHGLFRCCIQRRRQGIPGCL